MLGRVELPEKIYPGMVKVGFGDVGIFDKRKSRAIWEVCGEVRFKGKADIGHGSKICVGENAALTIGKNFNITAESSIVCFKAINLGNDCLIAWNVMIIDTDFHRMYCSNELMNPDKPISIGDRVWIGMNTKILKGALISNDSVVAAGALVNRQFDRKNVLLAGVPAKVVKESVTWEV
ncbi:MAG: acyltransferase [Flavobacterium sp.]|nr:MAG: acyltransferase [Flavobacterium sp.]